VADTHADAAAVARKYFTWGARYRLARQLGLSRALFTRQQLDQLGLGSSLESVAYEGGQVRLPPAASAPPA
jgi:NAD-specific glutamate dehydrogenase